MHLNLDRSDHGEMKRDVVREEATPRHHDHRTEMRSF